MISLPQRLLMTMLTPRADPLASRVLAGGKLLNRSEAIQSDRSVNEVDGLWA